MPIQTSLIGCQIEHYSQVASTNDIAIERGKTGTAEGTLIIAEHQTAGRGRYGRSWEAPPGKCLLVSVVFKHRLLRDQIALPNLIGAMAIAQTIRTTHGLDARIKMPNDVRIKKKKVAGVLTELAYDQEHQPFFVLGFGVNVNCVLEDFRLNCVKRQPLCVWRMPPRKIETLKSVASRCYVIYSVNWKRITCN